MKKKGFKILIVFTVLFSATTVYAYKNNLIKINDGKMSIFDITYNNVRKVEGNGNIDTKTDTDINLNTELNNPGDYTEFLVDITNNSNKNAKIDTIEKVGLTEKQKKYLDYNITYLNGKPVEVGDVYKAGETKTAKIRVEYLTNVSSLDLPTKDEEINYNFNITMVEK